MNIKSINILQCFLEGDNITSTCHLSPNLAQNSETAHIPRVPLKSKRNWISILLYKIKYIYCKICKDSNTINTCIWVHYTTVNKIQLKMYKIQIWGFTSRSTARVILGQVLSIATCGTRTH